MDQGDVATMHKRERLKKSAKTLPFEEKGLLFAYFIAPQTRVKELSEIDSVAEGAWDPVQPALDRERRKAHMGLRVLVWVILGHFRALATCK